MSIPTESNETENLLGYKWLVAYDVNDGECIAFPLARCALSTMVEVVHRSIEADAVRIREHGERLRELTGENNPDIEAALAEALHKIKQGTKRVNTTELLVRFDGKIHCVRDVVYCVNDAEMFRQLGITPNPSLQCDLASLTSASTSSPRSALTQSSENPSAPGTTPELPR